MTAAAMTTPTPAHPQQRGWDESLSTAVSFVTTNGRLPSTKQDGSERVLASWILNQRKRASQDRRRILDEKLPGWRGGVAERNWEESLARTAAYVASHGKNPAQTNPDPEVSRLAFWLRDQRMRDIAPERRAALDAAVPGWRGSHPGHRAWADSLDELREFVTKHGRLPRLSADDGETRLRTWLHDQRRRADDAQRARLDEVWKEWDEPVYPFEAQLDALKTFHATHGRLPRTADRGEAKALGKWLSGQRQTASPERRAALDAEFPGWHVSLESQWDTTLAAYTDFLNTQGRHPRTRTDDAAELSLSRWIQKQRKNATGERVTRLNAAAPGWRGKSRSTRNS